jgi:uncharacterized protein with GYD domain
MRENITVAFLLIDAVPSSKAQVLKDLREMKSVKETYSVSGAYNIVARIEVEDERAVESLASTIKNDEHVRSVAAFTVTPAKVGDMDTLTALTRLVGSAGLVASEYGGFEITVIDRSAFPWYAVFTFLLNLRFDIWISRKEESVVILSKTPHE